MTHKQTIDRLEAIAIAARMAQESHTGPLCPECGEVLTVKGHKPEACQWCKARASGWQFVS